MKAEDFIVSKRNRVLDSSQCTARVAFSPSRIRARQALFSDWGDRALLRSGIMRPWFLFSPHLAKMAESGDGMLVHYRSVATATVTSDAKIMVPRGVDLDVGRGEVDVGRAVAQREEDPLSLSSEASWTGTAVSAWCSVATCSIWTRASARAFAAYRLDSMAKGAAGVAA